MISNVFFDDRTTADVSTRLQFVENTLAGPRRLHLVMQPTAHELRVRREFRAFGAIAFAARRHVAAQRATYGVSAHAENCSDFANAQACLPEVMTFHPPLRSRHRPPPWRGSSIAYRERGRSFSGHRPGSGVGPPYPGGSGFTLSRRRHVSQSGGQVTQWTDKSANALAFSQATATLQPIYVTGALNGLPVLRFASSHAVDGLISNSATALGIFNNSYTFFIVCKVTGPALNMIHEHAEMPLAINGAHSGPTFDGTPIIDTEYVQELGGTVPGGGNTFHAVGTTAAAQNTPDEMTVLVASAATSSVSVYVNGSLIQTFSQLGNVTQYSTYVTVGAGNPLVAAGNYQYRFQGDIAEIIAYSRVISSVEQQQLEGYLLAKWGV